LNLIRVIPAKGAQADDRSLSRFLLLETAFCFLDPPSTSLQAIGRIHFFHDQGHTRPTTRREVRMLDEVIISRAIIDAYLRKFSAALQLDVAIVGGGPSGLVAGYYLAAAGKKQHCSIAGSPSAAACGAAV
jgi:hypothetical protein